MLVHQFTGSLVTCRVHWANPVSVIVVLPRSQHSGESPRRLASPPGLFIGLQTATTMSRKIVQLFVSDELHTITVSRRRFKTRWVAQGLYMGKFLTVEDQTEAGAMARWREAAESTRALTPAV